MPPCPVEGCRETRHHWHSPGQNGRPEKTLACLVPGRICETGYRPGTRCYGSPVQARVRRSPETGAWIVRAEAGDFWSTFARFATHADALAWALRQVGL